MDATAKHGDATVGAMVEDVDHAPAIERLVWLD